jgi:Family of unknown function (DUF5995)
MGWWSSIVGAVTSRIGGDRPEAPPPGQFTSVDALVARMGQVQAALPDGDGVRAFNGMYLTVTELVRDRLVADGFVDSTFMTRLDVVFAGLYLEAVDAVHPVSAWRPLFEQRHAPGVLSIQFALAGMNAHINHDLPIAVVRTCRQLGLTLDSPGVEADYQAITGLLAAVQEQVRQSFFDGIHLEVDRRYAAPLANLVGSWSIGRARDAAWTNARVLWEIRGAEPLRTDYLATLSSTVGMVGSRLLTPVSDLAV